VLYLAFFFAVFIFLVPAIAVAIWMRAAGRRLGYTGILQYLRAVPYTDAQRRDAVNLCLLGFIICALAFHVPPLVLVGIFPLFYGSRKVLYSVMGLGLVNDADIQDR